MNDKVVEDKPSDVLINKIPDSILLNILRYVIDISNKSFLNYNLVCKRFYAILEDEVIWKSAHNQCIVHLRFEKFRKDEIYWASAFPALTIRDHLSVKDMKLILNKCKIPYSHFLEKSEFSNAILTEANFAAVMKMPWRGQYNQRKYLLDKEKWGKWKISYCSLQVNKYRTKITEEELTSFSWLFLFKDNPTAFHSIAKFNRSNNRLEMNPPVNEGELVWKLDENGSWLQVNQFPKHQFFREQPGNFTWGMHNAYVVFLQIYEGFDIEGKVSELAFQRFELNETR